MESIDVGIDKQKDKWCCWIKWAGAGSQLEAVLDTHHYSMWNYKSLILVMLIISSSNVCPVYLVIYSGMSIAGLFSQLKMQLFFLFLFRHFQSTYRLMLIKSLIFVHIYDALEKKSHHNFISKSYVFITSVYISILRYICLSNKGQMHVINQCLN